ncbi:MAG: ribokinase [Acidimicrobiaceae bacterium]|nr:ribokinase [Acidimicrobiaceae bacterium]CAI8425616.1 MAG: Ribokinase [Acidimicrobiaceae bacterium]
MGESNRVVVIGSANIDLVSSVASLPVPGETVLGNSFIKTPGGKGANQAVAASKLGGEVSFVGCIGSDQEGEILRSSLKNANVNCDFLISRPEVSTGNAMIGVDAEGNNSIIVNSGANSALTQEDIVAAKEIVESAQVVLMQLEISTKCLEVAVEMASGIKILNPAPVVDISKKLLEKIDVLIPNRIELARLSNKESFENLDELEAAAKGLGIQTVIVTLGSAGALLVSDKQTELISSPAVESVDTTGAGDAFCGSMAESLSRGLSFLESVEYSVTAGALSTTTYGAQISMPTRSEVDSFLGEI